MFEESPYNSQGNTIQVNTSVNIHLLKSIDEVDLRT